MDTSPRIVIAPPGEAADQEAIKALFVEYAKSLGFSLAYQGFDELNENIDPEDLAQKNKKSGSCK